MTLYKKLLLTLSLVGGLFVGGAFLASAAGCAPFLVASGGTGGCTWTSSQIFYGNGTNKLQQVATTTLVQGSGITLSGGPVSVIGSNPLTITATGGSSASSTLLGDSNTFSGFNTFSTAEKFNQFFVTNASSTNATSTTFAITGGAANCNGTNALTTNSTGVVGCTAQPQGTVTSLTVTTNQGVSGSFTAGATPALTINLGALTAVTSVNGLIITANTGVITTGTWNGTTIATANGGTNQTSYTANSLIYIDSAGTTFKSSGSATSTLSLSAGLATTTGTLGNLIGGTSAIIGQTENRGFSYATTTAWTGTTTIQLGLGYGEKWQNAKCYTDVGTLDLDFIHNATHFNYIRGASTTVGIINMANAADTIGDKVSVAIGTPASSPTVVACTVQDIN